MKQNGISVRQAAWTGALAGFLNGLFGAGGGSVIVPVLEKKGMEVQKAHAMSLAVTVPLSLCSLLLSLRDISPPWGELGKCLIPGLAGALLGAKLLAKINSRLLRKIFGAILLISAVRIWLR